MDLLHFISYHLWYLRRPPWDSGIVPPEVVHYIATHPVKDPGAFPRCLLDLGCGTGTSSLAFARAGWTVTGVDFVPRAIRRARQKAVAAHLPADFLHADVTRPPRALAARRFDLVLDIGCFHGLSSGQKRCYLANLADFLAADGEWLLYAFLKPESFSGPGLLEPELEKLSASFDLVVRKDGLERNRRPSAWFLFRKTIPARG